VKCSHNRAHSMPYNKLKAHEKRCLFKAHGLKSEEFVCFNIDFKQFLTLFNIEGIGKSSSLL